MTPPPSEAKRTSMNVSFKSFGWRQNSGELQSDDDEDDEDDEDDNDGDDAAKDSHKKESNDLISFD